MVGVLFFYRIDLMQAEKPEMQDFNFSLPHYSRK